MTRSFLARLAIGVALVFVGSSCSADVPESAPPPDDTAEVSEASQSEDDAALPRPGSASAGPEESGASPAPAQPAPAGPAPPADPPAAAEDPAGLARQITTVEQTIRSDASEAEVAAAAHLQQAVYRRLARAPEWRDAVLAHVPAHLHPTVIAHVDAATALGALVTPQPQLPSWRIIAPPPADQLLAFYREAQDAFSVGWEYLAAIHLVETRMGRIRGTSSAGAQGPMQFMPATWSAYGEGDINDPRDAILAAGRYLSANGAPGNMAGALYAYNHSDAYVRGITAHAEQMQADPRMFRAYYHWQVYYRHVDGDQLLPVGYDGTS